MTKIFALVFLFAIIASCFAMDSRCREPVTTGPCRAAMKRYAYHGPGRGCDSFTYGGCQGNGNNFASLIECRQVCS